MIIVPIFVYFDKLCTKLIYYYYKIFIASLFLQLLVQRGVTFVFVKVIMVASIARKVDGRKEPSLAISAVGFR